MTLIKMLGTAMKEGSAESDELACLQERYAMLYTLLGRAYSGLNELHNSTAEEHSREIRRLGEEYEILRKQKEGADYQIKELSEKLERFDEFARNFMGGRGLK